MTENKPAEVVPRDATLDAVGITLISLGATQPDILTKALFMSIGVILIIIKYSLRVKPCVLI